MTMVELAEKVGITQPQLSRIENNINMVQLDTLEKICSVFDITLADFFAPTNNNLTISNDIKELLNNAKNLTPEQLKQLTEFLKTLK